MGWCPATNRSKREMKVWDVQTERANRLGGSVGRLSDKLLETALRFSTLAGLSPNISMYGAWCGGGCHTQGHLPILTLRGLDSTPASLL